MSESLPITTPPKRRMDHHPFVFSHLSESCKNTPNLTRKLEPYHHALLESGCQSAKSSPLPHRRLDKLEGVIRDKPSAIALRKTVDIDDNVSSSAESSPSVFRRFNNGYTACNTSESSPTPCRRNELSYSNGRRNTDCGCANSNGENKTPTMRRRVDSDCTCTRKISLAKQLPHMENMTKSECMCSPLMQKKNLFGSPAKSVLGEPGCFSSPIHRAGEHGSSFANFGSPAKSLLGEPGVFASPARSLCISPCDENLDAEIIQQPDQTVISGWLKFRDNKRWKIRWGVVTKLSPAAGIPDGLNRKEILQHWDKLTVQLNEMGPPIHSRAEWRRVWSMHKFNTKRKHSVDTSDISQCTYTKCRNINDGRRYLLNRQNCLHLQLYRDSKDRYKQGQTKASLSLQHFLGVESGFTLDKESNTIAIICQDVIVVLAFDTRERLIQWQVKISNNLGDDIQYLVLVSTAPSKAKLSTGPARMHVQDNRFCLTTGVPPKLAGLWDIGYLRRYGVVEGRFCFEGGSRCGKGEGLYIFVTDQGEEITHTLKLASQGKLATKRRAVARKLSAIDSPRKQISPRPPDIIPEDGCLGHIENSTHACICSINRTSYWPSQESRDLDSNYGCGDTVSVSEGNDSFNDVDHFPRNPMSNMERCMSCISKLGAPSMSRSSTATGAGTPASGQPPNWSLLTEQNYPNHSAHCPPAQVHLGVKIVQGLDRMSVCSSHGSFGSSGSEYSVPRHTSNSNKNNDTWYEHVQSTQRCQNHRASSPCQCCPPRPPKPKNAKPAMPLPITTPLNSSTPNPVHVGPYENYDIPKTPVQIENSVVMENYDTPKKIQEYLIKDLNSNSSTVDSNKYANYDVPASIGNMCGCLLTTNEKPAGDTGPRVDCTCNRVMSWADNWISLPYCRRGNGIENTGVPINKVKLSGEGKMPVVQPSGELAIYATVDMTKKINRRLLEECECPHDDEEEHGDVKTANYMNIDAEKLLAMEKPKMEDGEASDANYTNLEFALSLENYENAKEVLKKAGFSVGELEETLLQCMPRAKLCNKCGHVSRRKLVTCEEGGDRNDQLNQVITNDKPENYMLMEPNQKSRKNFPGYLPMSPATPVVTQPAPPLPSKELIKRIIGEKSASNPSLSGPAVDRSRKRSEHEARIPGSAMMSMHKTGGSPYMRKLLMDNSDLLPVDKRLNARKRSSSADSSRFLEDPDEFESSETLRKSSLSHIEGRRSSSPCIHQETEQCPDNNCCTKPEPSTETEDDTSLSTTNPSQNSQSQSVYIRRSASVPCKTQNRDSSSSNDSGVSTGSMRNRTGEFTEFELPLTTSMSARRHQRNMQPVVTCVHASLPRRSKSFDPLREITFQFQRIKIPEKSTSAEAEIPICQPKSKGYASPNEHVSINGQPYIDSRSTSSGTSDMSDYIETLSLSSHSSSDAPEGMRLVRQATSTLRPRSGKEYQNIDRSIISLTQSNDGRSHSATPSQLRGLLSCSANYANITPVPENAESPSPGYQSGGSPQDPQAESFMFKN